MSKYIVIFSKEGYAKYTSHLDINRLFRRSIRKQGIKLAYSQGFNPHPKMSFGQPLSLGYEAKREVLELETTENYQCWFIKDKLSEAMPQGIRIKDCINMPEGIKSLAAICDYAEYEVSFPNEVAIDEFVEGYLAQDEIIATKKNKKKQIVEVDIKNKIRELYVYDNNIMFLKLDSGSLSNLSPELVISTFINYSKLDIDRTDIEVCRRKLGFQGVEI